MKPATGSAHPGSIDGEGPEMQKYMEQKEKEVTKREQRRRKNSIKRMKPNVQTRRQQKVLTRKLPTRKDTEPKGMFGANIQYRPVDTIRIGFKNIHGFPAENNDVKFDYLKSESAENGYGFNIQSFGETNRRWNVLPHYKQLRAITEGWWERPSYQIAYLRDGDKNETQYGGVATICDKQLTSLKFEQGTDKMGRWTWMTLRGKKESKQQSFQHTDHVNQNMKVQSKCSNSGTSAKQKLIQT